VTTLPALRDPASGDPAPSDRDWIVDALQGERPDMLSSDVMVALPDPDLPESGARLVNTGRQAAASALALDARQYQTRIPVLRCEEGHAVFIEFVENRRGGLRQSTAVAVATRARSVANVVAFRHDFVPVAEARCPGAEVPVAAAESVVRRYLDHLEAGRAAAAVDCFEEDGIYSFPPRTAAGHRGTVQGREAIRSVFEARGVNAARHHIAAVAGSAAIADFVVWGRVTGLPAGKSATFLSCVVIGDHGLIQRYVAQMCIPGAVHDVDQGGTQ
jgi:ketosteroid isomerase-like protein